MATMSEHPAVEYYRANRRVVEALQCSRCIQGFKPSAQADIQSLLSGSAELHELEACLRELNIFAALGVSEKEIRHSRVLAWLLNPRASHGQGARYLEAFLTWICEQDGSDIRDYDLDFHAFRVETEEERIDILLVNDRDHFVCAIENKVRIDQGSDQLSRYRANVEKAYTEYDRKFVFLTLKNEQPLDPAFFPLDYATVLARVVGQPNAMSRFTRGDALSLLFAHYAQTIRNEGSPSKGINVLDVLHLARHELRHSDFIAWLLRPGESHGLGDSFGHFLLQVLKAKGANVPDASTELRLDDLEVLRERENIDVVAISERHRFVLLLENKLKARESDTQLIRYREFLHRHYSADHFLHVFLDIKKGSPSDSNYHAISYADLLPFFERYADINLSNDEAAARQVAIIVEHYCRLLAYHLWIKRKTLTSPPVGIVRLCEKIATEHGAALGLLLKHIESWQKQLHKNLEPFLFEVANRYIGFSFKRTVQVWFSFVPTDFDEFLPLRTGGGNPLNNDRMAVYLFFVIPFGDNISIRKPGIYLEFKLGPAKPEFERVKRRLHDAAVELRLFNRAKTKVSTKVPKHDNLLSHRVCSFQEAIHCSAEELKRRIEHRVERFASSFHSDIVAFLRSNLSTT
jgi:hypothetical protein